MKKLFLIIILICLESCSRIGNQSEDFAIIDCPDVYFSAESNIYLDSKNKDLDLDNVNYKASLNNHAFNNECITNQNLNIYNLDVLIITEPINAENEYINLPLFALLYDSENTLIDRQYFRINNILKSNKENYSYKITDIIGNLNIIVNKDQEISSITIGFVQLNY